MSQLIDFTETFADVASFAFAAAGFGGVAAAAAELCVRKAGTPWRDATVWCAHSGI